MTLIKEFFSHPTTYIEQGTSLGLKKTQKGFSSLVDCAKKLDQYVPQKLEQAATYVLKGFDFYPSHCQRIWFRQVLTVGTTAFSCALFCSQQLGFAKKTTLTLTLVSSSLAIANIWIRTHYKCTSTAFPFIENCKIYGPITLQDVYSYFKMPLLDRATLDVDDLPRLHRQLQQFKSQPSQNPSDPTTLRTFAKGIAFNFAYIAAFALLFKQPLTQPSVLTQFKNPLIGLFWEVLARPIVEEILFRGLLQECLEDVILILREKKIVHIQNDSFFHILPTYIQAITQASLSDDLLTNFLSSLTLSSLIKQTKSLNASMVSRTASNISWVTASLLYWRIFSLIKK